MVVLYIVALLFSVYLTYKYWYDPIDEITYNEKFKGKNSFIFWEPYRLYLWSGRVLSILALVFSIYMIIYELANN